MRLVPLKTGLDEASNADASLQTSHSYLRGHWFEKQVDARFPQCWQPALAYLENSLYEANNRTVPLASSKQGLSLTFSAVNIALDPIKYI